MIARCGLAIDERGTSTRTLRTILFPWLCGFLLCSAVEGASVISWGNAQGRPGADVPARTYVCVCGGAYHSLALTSEGRLVAWGEWLNGQCNVPGDSGFVAIAAGYYHNLALRSDGTIAAWGKNWRRQCNVPEGERFQTIAAGNWHSLAIRTDGSLAAWGWNEQGQCDPPPGNDYQAICAGHDHSLALKQNGALVAWGGNGDSQCDVPAGNDFVAIAAGSLHSLALRKDGSLVAWGRNGYGQCDVPAGNDFVAITANGFHSAALHSDGSVAAWGWDRYGQCDTPPNGDFTKIAAGGFHCLAMKPDLVADHQEKPDETELARVAPADVPTDVAACPEETAKSLPANDTPAPPMDRSLSNAQPGPGPTSASEPDAPTDNPPVASDHTDTTVEAPEQPAASEPSVAEDVTATETNEGPPPLATTAQLTKTLPTLSVLQPDEPTTDTAEPEPHRFAIMPLDAGLNKEEPNRTNRLYHIVAGIVAAGLILLAIVIFVRRSHLLAKLFDLRTWDQITTHRHY